MFLALPVINHAVVCKMKPTKINLVPGKSRSSSHKIQSLFVNQDANGVIRHFFAFRWAFFGGAEKDKLLNGSKDDEVHHQRLDSKMGKA